MYACLYVYVFIFVIFFKKKFLYLSKHVSKAKQIMYVCLYNNKI